MSAYRCHCGWKSSSSYPQNLPEIEAHRNEHDADDARDEDLASAFEEGLESAAAGPWIPVTERLPQDGEHILTWWGGGHPSVASHVMVCRLLDGRWSFPEEGTWEDCSDLVTHWAQIRGPK